VSVPNRYGRERIRRSLIHFLLGKGISSISGLVALLLVVRSLSVAEFATYSVLVAFVEIFTALTGVGFTHIVLRYVPELYALHLNRSLTRLVFWALLLRSFVLLVAIAATYLAAGHITAWFGLVGWDTAFKAYLLVAGLRITANFSFQILESMLHQGLAQLAFTLTAVSKLVLLGFSIQQNSLNLLQLITIETVAEAVGLTVLLFALVKSVRQSVTTTIAIEDANWLRDNLGRITKFGAAGYGQHLATMLYGGSPNRLLVGHLFDAPVVAAFGFAQSIIDFIRRYLPGQLLAGMVRPVLLARYASNKDYQDISKTVNLVFKTDFSLVGMGIVFFGVSGETIVSLMSKGKYGGLASELILAMLVLLILEALRPLVELSLQALERNRVLLFTNALLSSSILLAFPLSGISGVFAVIWANLIGMFINLGLLLTYLKRMDCELRLDWRAFARLIAGILLGVILGRGLLFAGLDWKVASGTAIIAYLVLLFISNIFAATEIQALRGLKKG
jgi:O-antigen/teichoic acid export membrane protein